MLPMYSRPRGIRRNRNGVKHNMPTHLYYRNGGNEGKSYNCEMLTLPEYTHCPPFIFSNILSSGVAHLPIAFPGQGNWELGPGAYPTQHGGDPRQNASASQATCTYGLKTPICSTDKHHTCRSEA